MTEGAPRPREKAVDLIASDEASAKRPVRSAVEPTERSEATEEAAPKRSSRSGGSRRRPAKSEDAPERSAAAADEATTPKRSSRGGRPGRRRPPRRRQRAPRPEVERIMLVHADPDGTQIAVLEEGTAVEHYVTREDDRTYVGNIYLGRVQNVLPGMEASFVDIGESRNGVLYAAEVGIAGDDGDEIPRIETVLKAGQPILVQVTKDPMRAKGARLTAQVSLAGRHLVLVPNAGSIGVSRKLPDPERHRLRDISQRIKPSEHGLIVRTAAEGASEGDLERDLERVLETWNEITRKAEKAKAPALVYQEPELELRVVRDLFNRDVNRCVVDDAELERTLRDYVRATTPDLDHRLELFQGDLPIFEEYRVLEQIRKSLDRKVWLPSGGHIVIERTEAMTVIDVNTGKFVGRSTLEETVFKTNKEAAVEVARQLRLRDIGGIIVTDFIDMEIVPNRDELIKVFRNELEKDRSRTQVYDVSPLGLVQMTRKNVSAGIVETFSDACPHCEGRGIILHDVD